MSRPASRGPGSSIEHEQVRNIANETENRWSFALESAGLGVWDADLVTGRCYYSRVWKEMLGYAEHEIGDDGDIWLQLVHPDDREGAVEVGRAHEEGLAPIIETEFRLRHKDGHWVWVLDRGKVIARDETGRPLRMIGVQTDITKQKHAEQQLALLNERIRLAVQAGGVGLWHWDIEARVLHWDARMHELYGTDPGTFTGNPKDWTDRLHPDDAEAACREIDRAVETNLSFDTVFRIIRTDGEVRHIRGLARVIRVADGPPVLVGTNWDVTEQVLAAQALADEKERLRITLRSIGDAVICTEVDGTVTMMNSAAEALTLLRETAAVGRPIEATFRALGEEDGQPLASSVAEAIRTCRTFEQTEPGVLIRPDGSRRSIRDLASPVVTGKGQIIGSVLVVQDVTAARALQRDLAHAASHDALTGLKCRSAFEEALVEAIAGAQETACRHALLYVDLDRFKMVNDIAGHAAGDALLKRVASAIRTCVHARDLVARLGGDEFAVLLLECSIEDAQMIAQRVLSAIASDRFSWSGKSHDVGASIGVSAIDSQSPGAEAVLAQADIACYSAKAAGRNRVAVYGKDAGDAHRHLTDFRIAADIKDAVETNRFRVFAQEIRDLASPLRHGRHVEVLIRMLGSDGTIIPPGAFIPAAEQFELMGRIDRWVLRTVLQDHGAMIMASEDLSVAVNLSANSLSDPLLWPFLERELARSPVDPRRLVLEITETAMINNFAAAEQFVAEARGIGCRMSLDDFGSGVSSFSYLKRFKVDSIKIDGAFVRNMNESRYDKSIVRLIAEVAQELGVETIAECIEDAETVAALQAIGVRYGQGFLFHRPRPFDEVLGMLGADASRSRRAR
jgi:diguanylate cyclase (GGDEF)-like protein/PAS domain S-box-containing protein